MKLRITILILFSCSLIFITTCETQQPSLNKDKFDSQSPLIKAGQRATMDTSKMKKRDGIPVMSTPGAQIDHKKVDSTLKEENTSYSEIVLAKEVDEIKKNIEELKQLLTDERVLNDKELQFSVHSILGTQFLRVYKHSEKQIHLNQAIEHSDTAISIFENQPEYKADLAPVYMARVSEYELKEKYDKAISLMKYLIEEYQGIGYGPYNNWFASFQVDGLHNLSGKVQKKTGNNQKSQEIVDYLNDISAKYKNEVGIAAQTALVWHYFSKNEQNKVKALSQSIQNRLKILDNPAFKKDKWERVQRQMERMEKRKAKHNH